MFFVRRITRASREIRPVERNDIVFDVIRVMERPKTPEFYTTFQMYLRNRAVNLEIAWERKTHREHKSDGQQQFYGLKKVF